MKTSDTSKDYHEIETHKSLMQYGSAMLRFVLWANGGGAVALLTFAGNVFSKTGVTLDRRWPTAWFLLGILLGGLAHLTAYFTQLRLYREDVDGAAATGMYSHTFWLRITIGLVIVGTLAFGVGSMWAVFSIATKSP
jgi:uncharacterized membrane protein YidH (DUF202 family)